MRTVSLAEAKAHLSELLNTVEAGEEFVITRHGRAVARVSPAEKTKQPLPIKKLATLRKTTPAWTEPSAGIVRQLRDAE
ncbi:type II toxin-antitoxin system prevent-host-death family antitoxin [Candidatus Accumulibacter phosphatis]|uniref:Antitoxin n=2 Tax=Candidatus Accumulibacter contiguus TaxID=2954381 RepID=A0ABX1T3T5_9PROT|nr:type II toxin-antitoxin system prevent-host-death family antitoxin [Candidatus Accumulibacter contiguus]